jgi:uncharacterized membrane protein (DUF106 family)
VKILREIDMLFQIIVLRKYRAMLVSRYVVNIINNLGAGWLFMYLMCSLVLDS